MSIEERPLTLKEAAERFGFKVATLRAEAGRGRLDIFRIGKTDYILPSDIGRMIRKMPRRRSPPRLLLDKARGQWIIKDGDTRIRTSCSEAHRGTAEKRLADYLGEKHQPTRGPDPLIADILLVYWREHLDTSHRRRTIAMEFNYSASGGARSGYQISRQRTVGLTERAGLNSPFGMIWKYSRCDPLLG